MKKKRIRNLVIGLFILFFIIYYVTLSQYENKHLMVYHPQSEEEENQLAEAFGVTLTDDVHVSDALLSYARNDDNDRYTIRITGVDSIYSFLTSNVEIDKEMEGEVTLENDTVYLNGTPIIPNERILNYEGTKEYDGTSIEVFVWGGYGPRFKRPFSTIVKISFFFEDGTLSFIECGGRLSSPFSNEFYRKILEDYYYRDYILYPLRPPFTMFLSFLGLFN